MDNKLRLYARNEQALRRCRACLNLHHLRKFRKDVVERLQFQERIAQPRGMVRCSTCVPARLGADHREMAAPPIRSELALGVPFTLVQIRPRRDAPKHLLHACSVEPKQFVDRSSSRYLEHAFCPGQNDPPPAGVCGKWGTFLRSGSEPSMLRISGGLGWAV